MRAAPVRSAAWACSADGWATTAFRPPGKRLGVVPRVGRAQAGPGAAGQLGEVRVGVQPEAGDEHAAVGVGLDHQRLALVARPHGAEGQDGRGDAG